jgi:hypothetical protein
MTGLADKIMNQIQHDEVLMTDGTNEVEDSI